MFETTVMFLAVALLCVVIAGGLYTVAAGIGDRIAELAHARQSHDGHTGRAVFHH